MIDDDYTSYSCIKLATYVEFYVRSELSTTITTTILRIKKKTANIEAKYVHV